MSLKLFQQIERGELLAKWFFEARTASIPKSHNDKMQEGNHRPMYTRNTDEKSLTQ